MTATRILAAMSAIAVVALVQSARAQETIKPGYWEAIDTVVSPIHSRKVDHKCVREQDVKKFMSCYINHHYTCDCPDSVFGQGQLRFRGTCVDNKGAHVKISGAGTYTATTLNMTAEVVFKIGGLPIVGRATTEARRIDDICPAPTSTSTSTK